jgi:hypothetical protein
VPIRIEVNDETMAVYGPFPMEFLKLLSRVSGKKVWYGNKRVDVQNSGANILICKESGFDIEWQDNSGVLKQMFELQMMATQHSSAKMPETPYVPKVPYLKHMSHCLGLSWERESYALFLEMGLCKTSITIHNFGILFKRGVITGVLIFAPKGVHIQWILDQIPEHLDPSIKVNLILWDKKAEYTRSDFHAPGALNIFALNIDTIITDGGAEASSMFIRMHSGDVFLVVDESHRIKNYGASTTKEMVKLRRFVKYRRILTGTPLAKNLADIWSQMMFLDPKIVGIDTMAVFKARFCVMGGYENRQIVESKNIEEFYRIIAPHSYRLTKAEATDLPPKMYPKIKYEMDEKTRKHYDAMKHSFMMEIASGTIEAKNHLSCVIKLQQLLSGYIVTDPKKHEFDMISWQRAELIVDALKQIDGQTIIWCAFIPDIMILKPYIEKQTGEECALLHNYRDFVKRKTKYALLNPSSGGTGLNLQFDTPGDNNAIYYNNTDRSLPRWQSEDRTWRTGMAGTAQIFDIICYKTVDQKILDNLKEKKDLSDLVLDDIRKMIAGE